METERQSHRESLSVTCSLPQVVRGAKLEPAQHSIQVSHVGSGAQKLGPSSAAFPRCNSRKPDRMQNHQNSKLSLIRDAGVTCSSLTCKATIPVLTQKLGAKEQL